MTRKVLGFTALCLWVTVAHAQITVNWNDVHQQMDGFGASSAWRSSITAAQADMFFSVTNGIGLSFLRNHIAPGGTTTELSIMQQAVARGAKVWSAPWSPPAAWKDNNNVNNGGSLLASHYQDYANQLAAYVASMKTSGVPIYALSIQNEPDYTASYESCIWSAQQMHDFIPYLSSALAAAGVSSTQILAGEQSPWSLDVTSSATADANTLSKIGILAAHDYSGSIQAFNTFGKHLWETEVSTFGSFDASIGDGLSWASTIHQFLTVPQVSAWHYWWLISANSDNEGLTDQSGNPAKRMYVLGNYSKFVRPGFYRIGVTGTGSLQVTAFKDPTTGSFAIVAINGGSSNSSQTFSLSGFTASSVTPWVTSSSLSLAQQAPVSVSSTSFSYNLPSNSVVTFVGQSGAGAAPDTTAPSVPTGLAASVISPTAVNLSWNASTDNIAVAGYKVFRNGAQVATVTSGTTYQDSGLAASTTYSYTVAAYDAAGNTSAQSSAVPASTQTASDTQVPTTPTSLRLTVISSSQIGLTWSASTDNVGVAGYKVFRNGGQVATVTSGTAYQDSGLVASTSYSYAVAAYDAAGNTSAQSTAASTVTGSAASAAATTSAAPSIFFTDLASGPNTGGENNNGAYVTIYGNNFGTSPTVTVGGGQALIKLAPSAYLWYQKMTIQLGPNAKTGNIQVTSNGTSNGLPFTIRAGNIYFVTTSGSDSNSGSVGSPWNTLPKAAKTMVAGDITYVRNGVSANTDDGYGAPLAVSGVNGTATNPIALVTYPGESAQIGGAANTRGVTDYPNGSQYLTLAGFTFYSPGSSALQPSYGSTHWNVVGSSISCPTGAGSTGCVTSDNGLPYFRFIGNVLHDTGCPGSMATGPCGDTQKTYHAFYWGDLNGGGNHDVEVGWNDVHNIYGCRAIQFHSKDSSPGYEAYNLQVHDNLIYNVRCDAINLANVNPNKGSIVVYNNSMYHVGTGPDPSGNAANYACVNAYDSNGTPTANVEVYNNTCYDPGSRGASEGDAGGYSFFIPTRMRNNLTYVLSGEGYLTNSSKSQCSGCTTGTNNLWYGAGTGPSQTTGNINADPLLVNASSANFRLQQGSPAIGAGVAISGLNFDILGTARAQSGAIDIGAFQYAAATTTTSPCDLNGDRVINQTDVNLAISQAIGTSACTNADLYQSGVCTVVDVQRVINAAQGATCRVGL